MPSSQDTKNGLKTERSTLAGVVDDGERGDVLATIGNPHAALMIELDGSPVDVPLGLHDQSKLSLRLIESVVLDIRNVDSAVTL